MNKIEMEKEYKRIFNKLLAIAIEDEKLTALFGCSLQGAAVDLMGVINKRDILKNNQNKLIYFSEEAASIFEEITKLTELLTDVLNNEISLKEGSEVPNA